MAVNSVESCMEIPSSGVGRFSFSFQDSSHRDAEMNIIMCRKNRFIGAKVRKKVKRKRIGKYVFAIKCKKNRYICICSG